MQPDPLLKLNGVGKNFTMHLRGGIVLPVFRSVSFEVHAGECAVLSGPSGIGKSSILKMIYANYRTEAGTIIVRHGDRHIDIASADPRTVLDIRRRTIGYISQFLRVIPRVSAEDVVAGPAVEQGRDPERALEDARILLDRLNVPQKLWTLPPATFSGGEQQRVNIARGLIADYDILLLDEPTASLDTANASIVAEIIEEKKARGVGMVGIFHDPDIRARVADRLIDVTEFAVQDAA